MHVHEDSKECKIFAILFRSYYWSTSGLAIMVQFIYLTIEHKRPSYYGSLHRFRCPQKTLGRAYLVGLRAEPCIAASQWCYDASCGISLWSRFWGGYNACIFFGRHVEKRVREIVLKAMGQAISKTVAIAEIIKKRIPRLHQDTAISSVSITDVWEPIEEGLFGDDSPCLNDLNHLVNQRAKQKLTREELFVQPPVWCLLPENLEIACTKCLFAAGQGFSLSLLFLHTWILHKPIARFMYQAPYHVEQPKSQYHYQPQNQPRQAARPPYNAVNEDLYGRGRGRGRARGRGWGRGGYGNYQDNGGYNGGYPNWGRGGGRGRGWGPYRGKSLCIYAQKGIPLGIVLDMKEAGVEGAEGMAEVEEGWVAGVAGVVATRHSQGISVPFALAEYAFA
ncbi:hypothetical protein CK203_050723 [Vitis vinifera]|uniref:DNA/RNA-binding protein Alba-like domain-containing protein n=1 Tax=Vitis vinifera TaxID=29760 RepID=A0A438H8F9_VITVI|nr:hypothetical protein CK203_050723 [Vitis vinifera]